MIGITVTWSTEHPVPKRPFVDVDANYFPLQNKANDYLIDREAQKTVSFTGIKNIRVQDMAVQEDQRGPLSDRTREHLGVVRHGRDRHPPPADAPGASAGPRHRAVAAVDARRLPAALDGGRRRPQRAVAGADARAHACAGLARVV